MIGEKLLVQETCSVQLIMYMSDQGKQETYQIIGWGST